MINNIDLIKPILNFEKKGDFYMLYIFKRKKDQITDKANHQSVRTIKTYCVDSIEHLNERYEEIKMLCEVFKARAYIHIQKQNHMDVSMNMITEIVTRIQSGQINQKNVFDSVVGQLKTYEKRWIIDIDSKDEDELEYAINVINSCSPQPEQKVETIIPTPKGYHIISSKFNVLYFKQFLPNVDIQKKNPTLLYYPESLN